MGKVIYLYNKEVGNMATNKIEKLASNVLETYLSNEIPVDPVNVAIQLGIPVKSVHFKGHNAETVCGAIVKDGKSVEIYVNFNDSINRKRFTIAHELGHYFLNHLDNKGEYVDLHRDTNNSKKIDERNADAFAAALLMEKSKVEKNFEVLKKCGYSINTIISELSELFIVSRQAMEIRLNKLGLING